MTSTVAATPARTAGSDTPILRPLRSALALPAAASAVVAGAAHLPVTAEHLHEVPYIGWMFVALIAVCTVGAVLLAVRDFTAAWWTLGVSCLAAVVFYLVSRGPGMPGMKDDIGDWTNQLGIISVLSEATVVVLAVIALWRSPRLPAATRYALLAALPVTAALVTAAGYLTGAAL